MILDRINSPKDLKLLSIEELETLAEEIRELIIDVCSRNGGHVGPNLGAVELTLALHYVFDAPEDRIIWDVGHQCYTHKIITGRKDQFTTLRKKGGLSGFPKPDESPYDVFATGHSSTSLSVALGLAVARDLNGGKEKIIAVIGDGAIGAGMAFEALNQIGHLKKDILIILNDNEMSIAKNVGALSEHLTRLITAPAYNRIRDDIWDKLGLLPFGLREEARDLAKRIEEGLKNLIMPGVIFEHLGFRYIGPIHGHNLRVLIPTLERIRSLKGPRMVHVLTKKGKGYRPAEENPERFHGIGPFDKKTGTPKKRKRPTYTQVFGRTIVELARKDKRIVAITAGMCLGTGLVEFREKIPNRFFDVGIAEQHAVTFAAGLARAGMRPVCAIYSTFLQRAYDQIIHDVCLTSLPVVFAIDRSGLVGDDGPTHHGPFDLTYLRVAPNMVIASPKDEDELRSLLYTAVNYDKGPFAIRYPRGEAYGVELKPYRELPIGKAEVLIEGEPWVLAIGSTVYPTLEAARILKSEGIEIGVVNMRWVKPLDEELLERISGEYLFTVEENSIRGGLGAAVLEFLARKEVRVELIGIPDRFIEHGDRSELLRDLRIDGEGIARRIREAIS
ncbi:1-deoxy-D-xylulose-5-phosphate synthase [candidate division WOR-3 bacterium]|uniref:1-deoxy-D-xylulose-5-phosphate synthase n=1 Tax=candidate division WOR-3 bacterium TaxID=2052148 RepID=A0A660SG42_UNCW3|nr:MAG: 1-deoxy-D-xylulose-5-phosphate synthase [candidate division WOR-3 bacterium]